MFAVQIVHLQREDKAVAAAPAASHRRLLTLSIARLVPGQIGHQGWTKNGRFRAADKLPYRLNVSDNGFRFRQREIWALLHFGPEDSLLASSPL
jgi:hypothetical protein